MCKGSNVNNDDCEKCICEWVIYRLHVDKGGPDGAFNKSSAEQK